LSHGVSRLGVDPLRHEGFIGRRDKIAGRLYRAKTILNIGIQFPRKILPA